jgi:hypothetical protein
MHSIVSRLKTQGGIYIAHNRWIPLAVAQENPVGVFFWSCKKILEDIHARYLAIQTSWGYFNDLSLEAPEYHCFDIKVF